MSEINVKNIPNSERKKFLKMAFSIYKNNPNWVPPLYMDKMKLLNKDKNPFWKKNDIQLFIVYKNGSAVGRIAAIVNNIHNEIHGDNVGFFGFFECINDQAVADKLFDTVKNYLKTYGFSTMRGPTNPSSNDEYGALIEGFDDPPRLMMSYNPSYYLELYDNYGFKKAKDLYAYHISKSEMSKNDKIRRVAEVVKNRYGLTIRSVNMKNFKNELGLFKHVYNKTWAPNWGFIPMSDEEIDAAAKDLKTLIDPDLVLFGEIDKEIVGVALVMPDYNQLFRTFNGKLFPLNFIKLFTQRKKINWARIIALGIIPEYQKKGLDGAFYYEILTRAAAKGIIDGEASWVLEDNEMMNRGAKTMNGNIYKKYRIYECPIQ